MPKALHFLDSLNRGGAETLVLDICQSQHYSDFDLIFAAAGTGDLFDDFSSLEIPTYFFERRLPIDPALIWSLRKVMRENEVSVVQGYQPVEVLHLSLAAIGTKVKTVHSFQGGGWFLHNKRDQRLAKLLKSRVDLNMTCSAGMLDDISERLGFDTSDFEVIHNSVNPEKIEAEPGVLKNELGLLNDEKIGGNVANFVGLGHKDQVTLCRALAKVIPERRDFHFVFVGKVNENGLDDFEECQKICREADIQQNVHFLGQRTDVPNILADLDLFVMSSRHEGLGISAVEAMFAGVPLILSDIPPFREFSKDGEFARHFEVGDWEKLSEYILEHLESPKRWLSVSKRAIEFAHDCYSIQAHMAKLDTLYRRIMD